MADCRSPDHEIEVTYKVALGTQSAALMSEDAARL